jgi:hypothetical protein
MMNLRRLASITLASLGLTAAAWSSSVYTHTFADAVTGDNEFKNGSTHYWFVDAGADSHANDVYERPTVQTYAYVQATAAVGNDPGLVVGNSYYAAGSSSPTYFGYLDIVSGRFGYDSQYMYFATELYSIYKVGNDGVKTADFGEGTFYNIRFSDDESGKNGFLLSMENGKDLTSAFSLNKMFAYYDADGSVGGTGGIATTGESTNLNGYETVVVADGNAKDAGTAPSLLWSRVITNSDGRPVVEFKFDYATFNTLNFSTLNPDPMINPASIKDLVFEATRGLKGQSNYLWNDKYTAAQAGTPYSTAGLGNIYELDTLRAVFSSTPTTDPGPAPIPLPASVWGGLALLGAMGGRRMYRRWQ